MKVAILGIGTVGSGAYDIIRNTDCGLTVARVLDRYIPEGMEAELITEKVTRTDVEVFYVPASAMAKEAGFTTLANMVLMGKLIKETGAVSFAKNQETFEKFIPAKKAALIEENCQAMQAGYDF